MRNNSEHLRKTKVVLLTRADTFVRAFQGKLEEPFELVVTHTVEETKAQFLGTRYSNAVIVLAADISRTEKQKGFEILEEYKSYILVPVLLATFSGLSLYDEELLEQGKVMDVLQLPMANVLMNRRLNNAVKANDSATFAEIEQMLKVLPSNIYLKDVEGRYVFATHYWHHLDHANDPSWTIRGKTDLDIRKDRENALLAMEQDKQILENDKGTSYLIEIALDGKQEFYNVIKEPIHDENGKVSGIMALINDVTEQELMRRKLERESYYDSLTGLLNRLSYDEYVQELKQRKEIPIGFLAADCNNLKFINDTYGHSMGNEYLRMCALVLREAIPEKYKVFRIGGDEFAAVFEDATLEEVQEYADKIEHIEDQFQVKNHKLSVAVGTSCWTSVSSRMEDSIDLADKEMYRNKKRMKESQAKEPRSGS